ncbi:hypothetical protein DL96DRAFT_568176 [Flagelloscypha sp. PMI_526]|nr:hypothetical protein DL96DRAFT_568176 [Flagelloscypha sp. PMI_526]
MGALAVQGYSYWSQFHSKDSWFIKLFAVAPIFLEIAQTIVVLHDGFTLFCRNFGNLGSIFASGFTWLYLPIMGTLTSVWVKLFYTWRLYTFTHNMWVSAWIFLLALLTLISGLITSAKMVPFHDVREFTKIDTIASVCLAAMMACDISIMASMIFFLRRSQTGFKRTDALLWRIISLSLETGVLCCLFTALHFIFWRRWPDHSWHLAVSIPEGKLYALSLLVILNQRGKLREASDEPLTLNGWDTMPSMTSSIGAAKGHVNIEISRQVHDDIALPVIPPRKSTP